MLTLATLTPIYHGALGVQDELALFAAPIVVLITLGVLSLVRRRAQHTSDRLRPRVSKSSRTRRNDR